MLKNFKNTKGKLLRTNAAIWFNRMCRIKVHHRMSNGRAHGATT
jgi:hypothetical protein